MSQKPTKTYQSFSSDETKKFGEKIATRTKPGENALVIALKGHLGAGKTTFIQGFFKGLGLKKRAASPTFIIMRRHSLPRAGHGKKFKNAFHVDAYRLKGGKHLTALGFKEIIANPSNVVLIEWADRVRRILPKNAVWLEFRHGKRENERSIMMKRRLK